MWRKHFQSKRVRTGVVLVAVLGLAVSGARAATDSPASELMKGYLHSIEEFRGKPESKSPEALKTFQKTHLQVLLDGLAKSSKEDPFRAALLSEITALYYTLGDLDGAINTMDLIVTDYPAMKSQFGFMRNRCELLMKKCPVDQRGLYAETLLPTFEETRKLITPSNGVSETFSFLGLNAECLGWAGKVNEMPKILNDGLGMLASKRSATAGGLKEDDKVFVQGFFDQVFSEMVGSTSGEKVEMVAAGMERVLTSGALATEPTSYLFQYAEKLDPKHEKLFQQFVERFDGKLAPDKFSDRLKYHLATSYLATAEPVKASKLFTELLQSPIGVTASTTNPSVDVYARGIVFGLAESMYQLGENEQAKRLFEQYAQLYPNDKRLKEIPSIR